MSSFDPGTTLPAQRERVIWVLNAACPSRCAYCDIESQRSTKGLDEADVVRVAEQIVAAGFREVTFVGGEPLLSRELPAAIRALAGRCGVAVFTGGLPGDPARHVDTLALGVDRIVLSIDAGDDALNDRVRGREGTTRDLLRFADAARTRLPALDIAVNSVVSRHTAGAVGTLWPRIRAYRPTTWALTLAGDNFQGSPAEHLLTRADVERLYLETAPALAREVERTATRLLVLPVPLPFLRGHVPVARWDAVADRHREELASAFDDYAQGNYNAAFSSRHGCPLPGVDVSIGVGGELYPCSQAPILQPAWVVGNVRHAPLAELLAGSGLDAFRTGVPHAPCRRCWAPSNIQPSVLQQLLKRTTP